MPLPAPLVEVFASPVLRTARVNAFGLLAAETTISVGATAEQTSGEPIVGNDAVAWEWTLVGTHTGTWGGVRATNQKIQLKGLSFVRIRDGKRVAAPFDVCPAVCAASPSVVTARIIA